MIDLDLILMSGVDYPLPQCGISLHQPTIKEISYVGETDFYTGVQYVCLDKTTFQDEIGSLNINNFDIFMTVMSAPEAKEQKQCVKNLFTLLLPQYRIIFTPQSLTFVNSDSQTITIDANNFQYLQQAVRAICCVTQNSENDYRPANAQAKAIADKIKKGRQRVAELKKNKSSIFSQYVSVLTVGIPSMSLQDLLNCTVYQLFDLMERYSLYINWDVDLRSRMTIFGAKNNKPLEDWRKNIH